MDIQIKRAYDVEASTPGYRVLVDRVWPRGVKKEDLDLDEWRKEIAPSNALRKWYGHDPGRWDEFQSRYRDELEEHADELARLREIAEQQKLLLIYSAKDEERNQAVVIRDVLHPGD